MTYTLAQLEVSESTYREIEEKLRVAGYDHAFLDEGIDMTHIALVMGRTDTVATPFSLTTAPVSEDFSGPDAVAASVYLKTAQEGFASILKLVGPVCDVCGDHATSVARDFTRNPSKDVDTWKAFKLVGKMRSGCDKHPVGAVLLDERIAKTLEDLQGKHGC